MFFPIVLSLSILCISLMVMQKTLSVFNVKQLTIPGFSYTTYIIFTFLPSIFVILDKPSPYRDMYFFAVTSVLLTMPIGICVANLFLRFKRQEIKAFYSTPVAGPHPSYHFRVVFALLLAVALTMTVIYLSTVRVIPLFEIIRHPGAYLEAVEAREEGFKLLDPVLRYPFFWLRVLIFPFLTILALGCYLQTHNMIWLILFMTSLIIGTFYAALSTAKWPVVVMFFMIFLFVYIYRQGRISKTLMFSLFGLMLAFPLFVILTITAGMDVGVFGAFKAIAIRVFYAPSDSIYYYFEVFPERVGYLYGRSVGKLSWLIGLEYFDVPNYIFQYRFPLGLATGSADAGFIGGLHADFGMPGVLIGGFFTGILMQVIHVNLLRRRKTILNMTFYSFFTFAFFLLSFSALPVILVSNGAIFVLLLPWMFSALKMFFRKATEPCGTV